VSVRLPVPADDLVGVWEQPEMRTALATREISGVYRLLRKHGVSQRQLVAMTGQSQSEVSEILKGRQVMAYDVLTRIADGLGVPRGYLGLAYDEATAIRVVGPADGQQAEEDESVKRRRFLAHAAQVAMGTAMSDGEPGTWAAGPTRMPAPERIGMTDVRQVEAATRALRALDYQYGPEFCREAVAAQLLWAKGIQEAEAGPAVKARLATAMAELESLAAAQPVSGGDESFGTSLPGEDDADTESVATPVSEVAVVTPPDRVPGRPVAEGAQRAIRWASRVLPVVERERYREEYLSELGDLAQSPHPRRAQLRYLLRLVSRIAALRFALRGPDAGTRELAR
jgi:transcriptional regulator with XRE-family HTH domain